MATHDYSIDNSDGATVRADINNALAAIVSNNSSASAPSTTFAYMWWADTVNGLLKLRNGADSDWITVATLAGGAVGKTGDTGSAILPSGTDAQRDGSPVAGYLRWNTDDGSLEVYDGSSWVGVGGASGLGDGSATTPAVNFSADTNTGVYRPGTDRLGFAAAGALVGEFNSTDFKFNSGYGSVATAYGCRAWVNFNGTGTVAIRASGNVSSITDNDTGDYTVNLTTAMPDTSYCCVTSGNAVVTGLVSHRAVPATTSAVTCRAAELSGGVATAVDVSTFEVSIFR